MVTVTALWNMPYGRELLIIAFTERAVWENKTVKIRVSENEIVEMSIPKSFIVEK